jgi:hypothetical protein
MTEDKEDWQRKYRSALVERNSVLQQQRIEEAYAALIRRIKETDDIGERQKLDRAIEMLNLLRNRI